MTIWYEREPILYRDGIQPTPVAVTVWRTPAGHASDCACYGCTYARRETCGNGEPAVTCCLSCGRPMPILKIHCPVCYWPPVPLSWLGWTIHVPLPPLRPAGGRSRVRRRYARA